MQNGVIGGWDSAKHGIGAGGLVSFLQKKLTFLHLFPVEVVILLGGLYHLLEGIGLAKYGNFVFKTIGEAIIELEMEGSVSPVKPRGKCVEAYQIFH